MSAAADANLYAIQQDRARAEAAAAADRTADHDHDDALWLAGQIADLAVGFDAAREIANNWNEGRNVGRLHPGMTLADYIVGLDLRLTLPEAMTLLPSGSLRQVAKVAAVGKSTVQRARTVPNGTPEPAEIIGKTEYSTTTTNLMAASTAAYRAKAAAGLLGRTLAQIEHMDIAETIAGVKADHRASTAKRLRKVARSLDGLANRLDGIDQAKAGPTISDGTAHEILEDLHTPEARDEAREQRALKLASSQAKDVTPVTDSDELPPCPVEPTFGRTAMTA
jgi:hypothetical protein